MPDDQIISHAWRRFFCPSWRCPHPPLTALHSSSSHPRPSVERLRWGHSRRAPRDQPHHPSSEFPVQHGGGQRWRCGARCGQRCLGRHCSDAGHQPVHEQRGGGRRRCDLGLGRRECGGQAPKALLQPHRHHLHLSAESVLDRRRRGAFRFKTLLHRCCPAHSPQVGDPLCGP